MLFSNSQLGHSRESIQKVESESDEFEQSLEEILERDLNVDSDRDGPEEEVHFSLYTPSMPLIQKVCPIDNWRMVVSTALKLVRQAGHH